MKLLILFVNACAMALITEPLVLLRLIPNLTNCFHQNNTGQVKSVAILVSHVIYEKLFLLFPKSLNLNFQLKSSLAVNFVARCDIEENDCFSCVTS